MCFLSLTHLCLCWTDLFDNIAFYTMRVLHMRSYLVSLSAEWLSWLAGWKGFMWQVCVISDSQGEALAWHSWSGSQQRMTELRSWYPQESKGWLEKSIHAWCSLPQQQTHGFHSFSTLLKLPGLSLRGKIEYLQQGIWIYQLHLTWKRGSWEMLVSHSCSPPAWYCCWKWSWVSQPS